MTVTQSVGFLENRDSSTISYNHFNQDPRDQYPTFSICLNGKDIYWKNEEFLYDTAMLTSAEYVKILKGNGFRYKINGITHLIEILATFELNMILQSKWSNIDWAKFISKIWNLFRIPLFSSWFKWFNFCNIPHEQFCRASWQFLSRR